MKNNYLLIAESSAAISDQVHSDQSKYKAFYNRLAQSLGGFPGIWNLIAECAIELERQHPDEWEDGWIECCSSIGDIILSLEESRPGAELVAAALRSQNQLNSIQADSPQLRTTFHTDMNKSISRVWTFASDSNPNTEYQTLQYADGTTSCSCKGWTRRVAADGSRSCKHTRWVDLGTADHQCKATHNYQNPKPQPTINHHATNQIKTTPRLGQRKFAN
jgi:hypothetical protein